MLTGQYREMLSGCSNGKELGEWGAEGTWKSPARHLHLGDGMVERVVDRLHAIFVLYRNVPVPYRYIYFVTAGEGIT